jgi:flagellar basal-body rod protein FlgF
MIAASGGMRSRMESLDMLANNVANSGVAGFKADREFYNLYTSDQADASDGGSSLPVIERPWTDFSQGTLVSTNSPSDLAIAGRGFFVIDSPSGPLYTRNGNFHVGKSGQLETDQGYALRVLRPDGKPATLDPSLPFEVTKDAMVRQDGQDVGHVEVADFDNGASLKKMGNTYFKVDASVTARAASGVELKQGSLESANVPVAESAVRLVSVMRQFEMLQRAISLGADMNRRAVEEVAKVS